MIKRFLAFLLSIHWLCAITQPQTPVVKSPYESFNLGVDFTPVIGTDGLTITHIYATMIGTQTDVTSSMIAASPAPGILTGTDIVSFRIQGGAVQQRYLLDVQVSDNLNGSLYDGQINLSVVSASGH